MDVDADLLVPELHVRGRLENFVGPVALPGDVRRGAIEGHREDHPLRVGEGAGDGQRAAEGEGRTVVILERERLRGHLWSWVDDHRSEGPPDADEHRAALPVLDAVVAPCGAG